VTGLVTTGLLLAGAGCGDETPTKADFIDRLQAITNPSVDRAVAACAYDRIGKDRHLLDVAVSTEQDKMKQADRKQLSELLAKCLLDMATTTTSPSGN
jgi:hypothetical protein